MAIGKRKSLLPIMVTLFLTKGKIIFFKIQKYVEIGDSNSRPFNRK